METDRSRIIAFQRCPRERYLAYHAHGTGLQKKSKGIALQFGSAFHEGAEVLLSMANIEEAVGRAQGFLINQFAAKSIAFEGEIPDDALKAMEYGKEEQMALAEALLRSWWIYEGQVLLENFEVIEVEKEGRAELTNDLTLMFRPDALVRDRMSGDLYIVSWKTCATFGKRNIDQARHDMQSISEMWGLMNDKEPRNWERKQAETVPHVYAGNAGAQNPMLDVETVRQQQWIRAAATEGFRVLPSASDHIPDGERASDEGTVSGPSLSQSTLRSTGSSGDSDAGRELSSGLEMQILTGSGGRDAQGSRFWHRVSETGEEVWSEHSSSSRNSEAPPESLRIEGILYKWTVKGRRNKDDWDGLYKQDTHLIYGWKRVGKPSDDGDEWSWSYKWKDDEINLKTGKQIGHTLGKGWQKVPIWREYPGGVKAWIDDLSQRRVFPRHVDPFVSVFPQALPVERRADEVERWKRQVVAQELRVADNLADVEFGVGDGLDVNFPQHTHSCHSYSGCPFIPICWDGMKAEVGELYQIRSANHPEKGDDNE